MIGNLYVEALHKPYFIPIAKIWSKSYFVICYFTGRRFGTLAKIISKVILLLYQVLAGYYVAINLFVSIDRDKLAVLSKRAHAIMAYDASKRGKWSEGNCLTLRSHGRLVATAILFCLYFTVLLRKKVSIYYRFDFPYEWSFCLSYPKPKVHKLPHYVHFCVSLFQACLEN